MSSSLPPFARSLPRLSPLALLLTVLLLTACGPTEADGTEADQVTTTDTTVVEEVTTIDADTIPFGQWSPDSTRSLSATVSSAQDVTLSAEVSGRVEFLPIVPGQSVTQGQTLLELSDRDNPARVQYQSALRSFDTTQISANQTIQSAESSLATVRTSAANAVSSAQSQRDLIATAAANARASAQSQLQLSQTFADNAIASAQANLDRALAGKDTAIAQAQTAYQAALDSAEAARAAEQSTYDQTFATLMTAAETSRTSSGDAFAWLDRFLQVTGDYKYDIDPARGQIGNNDVLGKNNLEQGLLALSRQRAAAPSRRPTQLTEPSIIAYAQTELTDLFTLRSLLSQMDSLIRRSQPGKVLSQAAIDGFTGEGQGYRAQIDGVITGLETQLRAAETARDRITQSLTGIEAQITQAKVALDSALLSTDTEIAAAQTAYDSAVAQAQSDLAAAQTAYDNTLTQTDSDLASADLAVQNAQASADTQVAQAESSVDGARASADLQLTQASSQVELAAIGQADLQYVAPFAGVISEVFVTDYQTVNPGTPLLQLSSDRTPKVEALVTLADAELLATLEGVDIELADGTVQFVPVPAISPKADPRTRRVTVEFDLPVLPEGVSLGSVAKVKLPVAGGKQTLIPLSAVSFEPSGPEVLIVDPSTSIAIRQPIQVGAVRGNAIEILSGLTRGSRVIRYRQRVNAGDRITSVGGVSLTTISDESGQPTTAVSSPMVADPAARPATGVPDTGYVPLSAE